MEKAAHRAGADNLPPCHGLPPLDGRHLTVDGSACSAGGGLRHAPQPGCREQGEDICTFAWGLSVIRPDVLVARSQAARCSRNRPEVSL